MAKTFISYRRADSATFAGRIYDRLTTKFGRKNIFKDVDNIPPGVNFVAYIQSSLRECAVALVIIGPHWLQAEATSDRNGRRLDDPADFVRIEVETALALGLTVIPVLVDGAPMPPAAELPDSLRELALINGIAVRADPDFSRDMELLIAAIERGAAQRRQAGRRTTKPVPRAAPSAGHPVASGATPRTLPLSPAPADPWSTPSADPATPGRAWTPEQGSTQTEQRPNQSVAQNANSFPHVLKLVRSALGRGRVLVALGLALLVVLTSLGVVLSQPRLRTLFVGGPSGSVSTFTPDVATLPPAATPDALAATQTVTVPPTYAAPPPTATRTISFPYQVNAPGPCDPTNPAWASASNSPGVSCPSDHSRTHMDGPACCNYLSTFAWYASNEALPSRYTLTFHAKNMNSVAGVNIDLFVGGTDSYSYFSEVSSSGQWNASRMVSTNGGSNYTGDYSNQGSLSGWSGVATVAMTVTPTSVVCTLNGQQVCNLTQASADATTDIFINTAQYASGSGTEPQADVYDFSIVPN